MSILADWEINNLISEGMILNAATQQVKTELEDISFQSFDITQHGIQPRAIAKPKKVISYGTSSYGYDVRCTDKFKIFTNVNSTVLDPLNFSEDSFVDFQGPVCIIPPNSFVLTSTVEYFKMPRDVIAIALAKSTYARVGLVVGVTPIEPEWEGNITIEISNTTPLPAKVYANQGITQLLFFKGERPEVSYSDRNGKYMGQTGITLPRG